MIESGIATIIVVIVVLGMLLLGMPIFICLMFSGMLGVFLLEGTRAFSFVSLQLFQPLWYFGWISLPAYIWLGSIFFVSGLGAELYDGVNKWVGRLPGGLGIATTISDALFGVISGSSMAACATMAPISYPAMRKAGYSESIATGVNASAGGLASMIPPSLNMIVLANISGLSLGTLFFAGFGPGFCLVVIFSTYIFMRWVMTPNSIPRGSKFSWSERFLALKNLIPTFLIFIGIFSSLYTGVCTATEAGVLGCSSALIICFARRKLSLPLFLESLRRSLDTCCMVAAILIGAYIINFYFFISGIQEALSDMVLSWQVAPFAIVFGMVFILMLLGMFLETSAMYMVTVPFFFPVIEGLGLDPVWFGIIMILSGEMAQITPPVGVNLFVIHGVTGVPLLRIAWGAAPYVGMLWLMFMLLYLFPQIALWLPSLIWKS